MTTPTLPGINPAPEPVKVGRFLRARLVRKGAWRIETKHGDLLGKVEASDSYAHFALIAREEAEWSSECLRDVAAFLDGQGKP